MDAHDFTGDGTLAARVAERFADAAHDLYLVGGPVRDLVLGRAPVDIDLTTDATPTETLEIVRPLAKEVWLQGAAYGTVGALIEGVRMEITTFRTEKYQPDSRHPEVAFAAEIATDLSRRDFTINAMAIKLPGGKLIDLFGGRDDLAARIVRTPIDPEISFSDDPLRMVRAFRFASQLDFEIDPSVLDTIARLKEKLATVSPERIRDELSKLLLGAAPGRALELADATGLSALFLPEMSSLKLEQDPIHKHKDVFHHTLAVVERSDANEKVRLAALLHDIGKPKTRKIGPDGVSFHHHEIIGAKMAVQRLRALRYPNEIVHDVSEIIRLHHRFHTYRLGWTDSAVRRYVKDAGPLLGELNALVRADCTTRNPAKARTLAARMDELEARIRELAEKEEIARIRPELDGEQVMAYLGVPPGPTIGRALSFLLELRLDEGMVGEDRAYEQLAEWAREQGIEPAEKKIPPRPRKPDKPGH